MLHCCAAAAAFSCDCAGGCLPVLQCKNMVQPHRALATGVYLAAIAGTLAVAFSVRPGVVASLEAGFAPLVRRCCGHCYCYVVQAGAMSTHWHRVCPAHWCSRQAGNSTLMGMSAQLQRVSAAAPRQPTAHPSPRSFPYIGAKLEPGKSSPVS
jgi:hypothetical protein